MSDRESTIPPESSAIPPESSTIPPESSAIPGPSGSPRAASLDSVGIAVASLLLAGVTLVHLTIARRPEFYTHTGTLLAAFRALFLVAGPPLAVLLAVRSLGRRGVRAVPVFLTCFGTLLTVVTLLAVGRSLLG